MIKYIISPEYQYLEKWIQALPNDFDNTGTLIYDKRNKVRTYTIDGEILVVKKYKKPYIYQRFDYTFIRSSKAKRAFLYAEKLGENGIDTPKPIAFIEKYNCGLFTYGYFVSAYCADEDCRLLNEKPEKNLPLLKSLVSFIIKCHNKGFIHGDPNLSNYLFRKEGNGTDSNVGNVNYHISTIDINRSRFVKNVEKEKCLQNLVRITHERKALEMIATEYALQRGWNVTECVDYVIRKLKRFEEHNIFKIK